mmetsp:Transcript_55573/g.180277  ORF Transcript_55573/g.180277 Transcript_55573/m.180277 type:complete len:218 (+) Transcript_55573:882-1535(+)
MATRRGTRGVRGAPPWLASPPSTGGVIEPSDPSGAASPRANTAANSFSSSASSSWKFSSLAQVPPPPPKTRACLARKSFRRAALSRAGARRLPAAAVTAAAKVPALPAVLPQPPPLAELLPLPAASAAAAARAVASLRAARASCWACVRRWTALGEQMRPSPSSSNVASRSCSCSRRETPNVSPNFASSSSWRSSAGTCRTRSRRLCSRSATVQFAE